jgi:hypothetical protein
VGPAVISLVFAATLSTWALSKIYDFHVHHLASRLKRELVPTTASAHRTEQSQSGELKAIDPHSSKLTTPSKINLRHRDVTPCDLRNGSFYSSYSDMPGGPNLRRPLIVVNEESFPVATSENVGNGSVFLFMKLVLTNRGETSIVKDWELCTVEDGRAVKYQSVAIPKLIEPMAASGEMITPEKSLVDNAVKTPIKHAHTVGGWVTFKVTKETADRWKSGKHMKGSVQYRDYLDHLYSFGFDYDPTTRPTTAYVPGAPD